MKIVTIFGTRPEIIRLSVVMRMLDEHCDHYMVHTGQNYAESLSDIFFRDLGVRTPDEHFGIQSKSFGDQAGQILARTDDLLRRERPDRVLILGDTNSALSAIVAARLGVPVFHMEAGNRCFDDRVPEEVNRRLIDHSSTILLPYTERSRDNLIAEGIGRERIYVTGNPIAEVIHKFDAEIAASSSMEDHAVAPAEFFLVTLHRAENTDGAERLKGIFEGLRRVSVHFDKPVLVSVHPRTADKVRQFGVEVDTDRIKMLSPLGFFDFVNLEKNARAVLTDSGTVQEECAIFGVPNVTVRDVTERPETLECGSNILSGGDPDSILNATKLAVASRGTWQPPVEYTKLNVAETAVKIVLGHLSIRKHTS